MRINFILTIILISILLIYILFFTYLFFKYVIYKNNVEKKEIIKEEVLPGCIKSRNNTEFYNRSIEYAEKVLQGREFNPQYGEPNFYANKLIDTINKINQDTKSSVIIAIKYFSIEPAQARATEELFRSMADQEHVPLWFIILREAMKKAVPELMQSITESMQPQGKVIPLYQQTG